MRLDLHTRNEFGCFFYFLVKEFGCWCRFRRWVRGLLRDDMDSKVLEMGSRGFLSDKADAQI